MAVQNKEDIIFLLKQHKDTLKNLGIEQIGLFGSFIRNEQSKDSDIDLLVEFDKARKTFRNFIHTAQYLESFLGRKVEILTPESLSLYIGPHIRQETEYVKISD